MKSRAAFEHTVAKMVRKSGRLYFWTFTFRDVHSLKRAMSLWNEFLTILKKRLQFRGVRVLELHDEHGCHFHVVTDRRYQIRPILEIAMRYGFGRTDVRRIKDAAVGVAYLCKYLSKGRPPCLKRVRLWAAFGEIARTRVADIVTDSPYGRILREVMGCLSPDELLEGNLPNPTKAALRKSFHEATLEAQERYLASFDPSYERRQRVYATFSAARSVIRATPWFGNIRRWRRATDVYGSPHHHVSRSGRAAELPPLASASQHVGNRSDFRI